MHTPLNFDSRYLFLALYVLKIRAHFFDVCAVSVGIPMRQEMLVAVVGMLNAVRVPDRAAVLFRAPRGFHYESHQSVGVRTVGTIDALQKIQVAQFPAVKNDVVRAARLGYP